jgi:replicative DNA helicase
MNALIDLRLPPHSIDAEHSVLGGLLFGGEAAWDRVADAVSESDFYRDDHRRIFRHIALLAGSGKSVDVVTVFESIERANEVDQTGGLGYLGEIANAIPSAANIRQHADIVRQRAVLRELVKIGDQIAGSAMAPAGRSAETIASEAEARFAELFDSQADEPVSIADAFDEALTYIDSRGAAMGLATCLRDLDGITGGLEPGQLIVIAARPSVGKSALGLNIADHIASNGGSAAFFSLEMQRRELTLRLIAARTGISVHAQKSGNLSDAEWTRIIDARASVKDIRLFIDDKPAVGLSYIRTRARRLKRKHGLALIVVDYLQLMTPTDTRANRTEQVGSLSRGLKALAKELHLPVIALAQLNRDVEKRIDKRPFLSDLRESGAIEQDADIVAMLHTEPGPEWAGVAELLVRKNRNGPIGDILLRWFPNEIRFTDHTGPNPRRKLTEPKSPAASRRGFDD